MRLKRIFCRHKELSREKTRYENMKYNEYFGRVIGKEVKYRICKKCGEEISSDSLRIVFLKDLNIELKEDFMKKRNGKTY